jgi:hypothetical protein
VGLGAVERGSPTWTIGWMMAAYFGGWLLGSLLVPGFVRTVGLEAGGIAGFMGAVILGGILFQFPLGALSDLRDRRVVLVAVALAGAPALGAYAALRVRRVAAVPEVEREKFVAMIRTSEGSLSLLPGVEQETPGSDDGPDAPAGGPSMRLETHGSVGPIPH